MRGSREREAWEQMCLNHLRKRKGWIWCWRAIKKAEQRRAFPGSWGAVESVSEESSACHCWSHLHFFHQIKVLDCRYERKTKCLQEDAICLQNGQKGRVGGIWHRLCSLPHRFFTCLQRLQGRQAGGWLFLETFPWCLEPSKVLSCWEFLFTAGTC